MKTKKGRWEHRFITLFFIRCVVCSWQGRGEYAFCREVKRLWTPQGETLLHLCSSGPNTSFRWDWRSGTHLQGQYRTFRGQIEDSKCQARQNISCSNNAWEATGTIVQIYCLQRNPLAVAAVVRPAAAELWGKSGWTAAAWNYSPKPPHNRVFLL